MECHAVYHGSDPRSRQKPSGNATAKMDRQPLDIPLPNFYYSKSGVKRKSCKSPESVKSQSKRVCVSREISNITIDDVLAMKSEVGWLRHQETRQYMRMREWPKGDLVWTGCDVTKQQRADTVNWLIIIHQDLHLEKNTLFVAVNILDRFIQKGRISKKALRPLALSCLWIAAKVSEHYYNVPKEKRLIKLLDPDYTLQEFRTCECMVLRAINFNMWRPTALQFAEKYASLLKPELVAAIREKMCSALELSIRDLKMSSRNPSEVGLAALCYALGPEIDNVAHLLKDVSGYDIHSLQDRVIDICNEAFCSYKARQYDAIFNKYPKAFSTSSNIYLHILVMGCKK